ncbi:hypothetical protein OSB04_010973 [Centaurea solstitialis]|uniref:Uncharacterized protein n=1 Tax=Centaurea solstitialis TaxID=347529 RepID=A0AA38TAA3_9ASTR|nr:hypothetical protein OSB04_010973 [Centaurea solstitialis]
MGTMMLRFTTGMTVTWKEVLHVPNASKKLVSMGILMSEGYMMGFISRAVIFGPGGTLVYAEKVDDVFRLQLSEVVEILDSEISMIVTRCSLSSMYLFLRIG